MDALGESWLGLASRKMDWAAARQKTIAENMANADTPNYVGRDVSSFDDFLSQAETSGERIDPDISEADFSWGGSFDGNRIVLEEQSVLSASASSDFETASKLMKKGYQLLNLAASSK